MATWSGKLSDVYWNVAFANAPPTSDGRREQRISSAYPLAVRG
jgi:hypothetical protein